MAVGGQRGVRRGVPEGPLDGHDVAARGDQPGCVEVPEVVQPEALQSAGPGRLAPLVADGVLVRRRPVRRPEEPAVRVLVLDVVLDVPGEQLEQWVGEGDGPLRAVLGRAELDGAAGTPLHLPADREPAAEEVDVVYLHRGGLAEAEAGEGAERDEGREPFLGGGEERTYLGGRWDGHGLRAAAAAGERDAVAGVGGDEAVAHRSAEDRADVLYAGVDRAGSEAGGDHGLDPGLDVRAAKSAELHVPEGRGPDGQAHGQLGAGRPDLPRRP